MGFLYGCRAESVQAAKIFCGVERRFVTGFGCMRCRKPIGNQRSFGCQRVVQEGAGAQSPAPHPSNAEVHRKERPASKT